MIEKTARKIKFCGHCLFENFVMYWQFDASKHVTAVDRAPRSYAIGINILVVA